MDMNTNRYEKLVQVPSRGPERASSDDATIEQGQSAYRQSTKTTVTDVDANFAGKPEPTQYQGTAVTTEEAGTDGTTNVQCRSIDCDNMRTTVMKLPTDCVKFTEPTLTRVSPVVAKMAHKDGTRVMQYKSDDQKTTNMQMPMDFLEIPEPTLPRGFLELAEEARNVKIESGQFCYTEEVQSQGTGLTRPVFVTAMEYSSPVLEKGAIRAAGVSSEMIPTRSSAGRRKPVDRSGLVGPQNKTDQPVLTGSDEDQVGTVPTGPVGPDIIIDRIQPVAEGPLGQFSTRRPVGTDGMFSTSDSDQPTADGPVGRFITHSPVGPDHCITSDSDQPMADGPVGRFITHSPVGPDHAISSDSDQPTADGPVGRFITYSPVGPDHGIMSASDQPTADGPVGRFITHSPVGPDSITSACDPDRPVADGPVGQSFIAGPVGPRWMFSPYELNQPVTVGLEDQTFTSGPVGTHEGEHDCKRTDQISESPVGSTEILDRVKQTEGPIQTDFMKSGTINEPASSGDTPPSSDSGVHSLGEQWENMSTSYMDTASEQNNRQTHGNVSGRRVSDSRVPPNTEKDEDMNYPWTDCLLNKGLDDNVSIDIQHKDRNIQYNGMTVCEKIGTFRPIWDHPNRNRWFNQGRWLMRISRTLVII